MKMSIVMATYKREHSIQATLDTIYAQTNPNWELLLMDDEPGHVYPPFADPRIVYHRTLANIGMSRRRNMGIGYATGDVISMFDDDDIMDPQYVDKMLAPFADPKVMAVHCGIMFHDKHGWHENWSYSSQQVVLRKEVASPTWSDHRYASDQDYYGAILPRLKPGALVKIPDILCHLTTNMEGGLRAGKL